MKTKTLTVKFESWNFFKERTKKALEKKIKTIGRKDTLLFSSVTVYQKFMTEQKLAILAMIKAKTPGSIYQLAQLVDRDFANVQRDCISLEAMGFITLEDAGDAKGSKQPRLSFDYCEIRIEMPNAVYSHNLGEAA